PDDRNCLAGGNVEVDAFDDVRRLRAAITEPNLAQFEAPLESGNRLQRKSIAALLGLLLEDVVETIEQHRHYLQLVPDAKRSEHRPVSHSEQRVKGHKSANGNMAAKDHARAYIKKKRRGQQADRLDCAVIGHDNEISAEAFLREGQKVVEHQ